MKNSIEIKPGVHWIGALHPELRLFDDLFYTEHGTTYNSYLIKGADKTAIIDTVKFKYAKQFLEKVSSLTDLEKVDYIVVNHAEPDHSGSLSILLAHCPNAVVVSTMAAKTFVSNMIHKEFKSRTVKDGDTIDLGGRTLRFFMTPFLHWPDTMFTRLEEENILFTCDAFGAHFCNPDSIFNDECEDYTEDRAYYFDCLVRPFKDKVLTAIEKVSSDVIDMICPSHGPIIRSNTLQVIQQYTEWSKPPSPGNKIAVMYVSPHGSTEKMAKAVVDGAIRNDIEVTSHHIVTLNEQELRSIMEEADLLAFGVPTINRDIPKPMWDVLTYLSTIKLKTNLATVFGSYGWSGEACKMTEERLKSMGFKIVADAVRASFVPRTEALIQCQSLGNLLSETVLAKK
jgi:flavorubredoxin